MNIRKFKETDLPKVLKIYAESKLDELCFEKNKFTLIRLEDDPKRFPSIMESDIYVYEMEDILGFGAIFDTEIRALFVAPQHRGKGIGKCILDFLLTKNQNPIILWVTKSNIPARQLYKSYGFVDSEEFWVTYNEASVLVSKMVKPNQIARI